MKECHRIIKELIDDPRAGWFLHPVDITRVPDYYDIIHNPMDLGTIRVSIPGDIGVRGWSVPNGGEDQCIYISPPACTAHSSHTHPP